ncbi:hypothetical protein VTN96DRAFT_6152 [Rasamsonia emersonii]|uniref:Transcription factor BYE1 n=1 Tax=Rasamsonia emersonii (strain ATCC 16479 / CBS 393.64 / IMI 116815) TaxID=1408163 RepID=A0A0F4YTH5_RASE3|nr:hypothetical protein T310_4420 [Rasamsonia emersonii CBS 393.64]KKA21549.1 hypothetical protein T310_4420 [Rasamsonia emersonii CBS 393.64]
MTEEPRRSGRATKGQHKNLDLLQEVPTKKTKAKAQPKEKPPKPSVEPTPAPSEEEEIIRCICGEYEEEEDIERDMICCDKCSAWQHNDCMGLTFAKGEEPAEYFCEICKPENHQVLLEKIARGEKPWEEAARRRQQEVEEKKAARRRKGRKGKRGGARQSDATKVEGNKEVVPPTPAPPAAAPAAAQTPVQENKTVVTSEPPPSSTQKRKFDEHQESTVPEAGPKQKQQRVSVQGNKVADQDKRASPAQARKGSTAEPTPRQGSVTEKATAEVAGTPEEIGNAARRSCANALVKLFVDQIHEAQKQGTYQLPEGKSVEDVARPLGLSIEHAMYLNICGGTGEPNEPYKSQLRTILFNVKKNTSLRDRLLVGSLAPNTLSTMSTQDMASEELQQKDAEIKREAEKQHIIVQEQGPRIRRTHKGEELVEDDNQAVASESIFSSAAARRAVLEADGHSPSTAGAARSVSPKVQRPPEFGEAKASETRTATDFNGTARAHSPDGTGDQLFPEAPVHLHQPLPTGKVQADEEIDKLLKDEDAESPPYSPKEYESGIIWRGRVSMHPVAEFTSSARHVGGADLSGRIPWSQLVPPTLLVDGRIDIQLAGNYLCGLRFSSSTDVTVLSMSAPDSPAERAQFDKLFNYFVDRKRYGVVGKHPLPAVKDTYIIPIEAGASKKPEFIELLENNSIEDPTPDRILLAVFVVKTSEIITSNSPSEQQPTPSHPSQNNHAMAAASPLTSTPLPQHAQYTNPAVKPASQASPAPSTLAGSPHPPYNNAVQSQPPQQPGYPTAAAQYPQYQSQQSPPAPQQVQQPHLQQLQQPQPQPQPQQQLQQQPQQQQQPQAPLVGAAAAAHVLGPQAKAPAIEQLLQMAPNADVAQLSVVRDILARNPAAANDYEQLMQAIMQAGQRSG